MARAVVVHSTFNPGIDAVARVLEGVAARDDPLSLAWRDRMAFRRQVHRDIVARLADEGQLAPGWTVEVATDLFHTVTLPASWRELTQHGGWSAHDYVDGMTRLLRRALVVDAD